MGTAIIDSHLGGGLYRVRLQFDNNLIQLRIAYIDARILEIDARLSDIANDKSAAKILYDGAKLALDNFIDATPPAQIAQNLQAMEALTAEMYKTKADYDLLVSKENREKLSKTELQKDRSYLTKYCPSEISADIWCVHLVTTLTGTIKTIEVDYALERDIDTDVIKFDTGCWLPAQATSPDTKLQHPMATSQHANWFNLAMLPAAQRDAGRYRVATLLDVATGYIQLDGQFNTEEYTTRLVNKKPIFPVIQGAQREYYTGAPIKSLSPCGSDLYVNGDRVIVDLDHPEFIDPKPPVVIGFHSNPRLCESVPPPQTLIWPAFVDLELVPYANRVITGYYSGRFIVSANYLEGHYWQVGGPSEGLNTFLASADRTQIDWAFTGDGWLNNAHTLTLSSSVHKLEAYTDYYSVTMEANPIPPNDKFLLVGDNMVYWDNFGVEHQIGPVEPGNLTMPSPFPSTPPKYGEPAFETLNITLKYSLAAPALKQYTYSHMGNFTVDGVTKWYVRYLVVPPATETYP